MNGRFPTFETDDLESFTEIINNDINPAIYLAIDPGKFNGACGYDANYRPLFMYVVASVDMIKFVHAFKKVQTCIIEDYRLYTHKAFEQVHSDMETSRVIGRVEGWAELSKTNLIKQGANVKKTGYLWIGQKPPPKSSNKNDPMDAHVHFMYWAVKTGRIKAEELLLPKK